MHTSQEICPYFQVIKVARERQDITATGNADTSVQAPLRPLRGEGIVSFGPQSNFSHRN